MDLQAGDILSGFKVIHVRDIPEYRSIGVLCEHEKTGCRAYQLVNDDRENLFSFIFKTPPEDSKGTSHIMEHSVLSGSRAFPIKDPFVALMKGSMNTFLNAMTYPDKTVYPASSTVEKDFFNLFRVYGDAVFFPLLKEETFHQEGIRHVVGSDGELQLEGVVYNEMKGNYSTHEAIVGEWSVRSLFTDSIYRFDSGGDPAHIRNLTYGEIPDFHKKYYHPSNCLIFLYGDIPPQKNLAFLSENLLAEFGRQSPSGDVELQPRWTAARLIHKTSPLGPNETPDGKTAITLNWLTDTVHNPFTVLSLEVLAEILLGNAGSPMQKAIVDSGLGEDVSPVSGLESDSMELVFTFGLRGSEKERAAEFEALVLGELERLARDGISKDVVDGSMRRVEFRNREIRGGIPFGLLLMSKSLRGWLHGSDPEATLEFTPWMEKLKAEAENTGFFENLIRKTFLDNPHRTTVVVSPSPDHASRENEDLDNWKSDFLAKTGSDAIKRIKEENDAFAAYQQKNDDPADIAKIPSLSLNDVPREVQIIDIRSEEIDGVPLYSLDVFANGILYVDFVFDVQDIDDSLVDVCPFFCRATCGSGLPGMSYDEVARQLAMKTGGFTSYLEANSVAASGQKSRSLLMFRVKMLESDLIPALDLIERLLLEADFSDKKRMTDVFLEFRNDVKAQILPGGSSFAALRAGGRLSPVLGREERWKGIDQYLYLSNLGKDVDGNVEQLCSAVSRLRNAAFTRSRLTLNVTGTGEALQTAKKELASFVGRLPKEGPSYHSGALPAAGSAVLRFESLLVPSTVTYSASVIPASSFDKPEHAHEVLLAHLLKTDYLWEQVRMRGGAYGVVAAANGGEGLFTFASYRDPHIIETLDAYRAGLERFSKVDAERSDIEKAIIGVVGKDIRPMAPGEKGIVGLRRNLYNISNEMRQRKRDEIIGTSPANISEAARRLSKAFENSVSVTMAGKEAVQEAAVQRDEIGRNIVELPL